MFLIRKKTTPVTAYNLWAEQYDNQPDNLMLALDNAIFSTLFWDINVKDKVIADIGCGTGRHWKEIFDQQPYKLIGFDVSEGMLNQAKQKYPDASVHLICNNYLPIESNTCDIIISTLTIAHIKNLKAAFREWNRILKPNGIIIITDYHPVALGSGGDRTFHHNGKLISIVNYLHPIKKLISLAHDLGWEQIKFVERLIDEEVKSYYEKQKALAVFYKFKNVPIIYGLHLKKKDVLK